MADTIKLKADHLKNGNVMIGDTLVKFDADGVSENLKPEVARAALGVPGVALHEGELAPRAPDGALIISVEVQESDGSVRGQYTRTGTVDELFPDGRAELVLKLAPVEPTKSKGKDPKDKPTDAPGSDPTI